MGVIGSPGKPEVAGLAPGDRPRCRLWKATLGCLVLFLALGAPAEASAQSGIDALAGECAAASVDWCRELALTGTAARAGFSLLAGGGSELLGSAGTLGIRLGSVPRIALAAEAGYGRAPTPRFGTDPAAIPLDEGTFGAPALQLSAGAGVFDGFSPAPTVGGILSVDLLATGSLVMLPAEHGFDGSAAAYGVGARVGILRESFTAPGVSISAVHRWGGEVTLSPTASPNGAADPSVAFETSTTSLRATVGKDLVAVGLLAGLGWDRHAGAVRIRSGVANGSGEAGTHTAEDLVDDRFLAFGGASLNFLILQLSAEAGWARGLDAVEGRSPDGGFDPTAASWFGSLGARLTY